MAMYPRNYSASDVGTTIRNPSTALLCIDSEVRFATIDNVPEAIQINFNEIVQLNNYTLNIVYV